MKKLDRLLITTIEFREYKMRPAKLVMKDLIEKNNDALVLFYVFSFADCLQATSEFWNWKSLFCSKKGILFQFENEFGLRIFAGEMLSKRGQLLNLDG